MTIPYTFQQEDIEVVERGGIRHLLSWEQGLGKTFGALLLLKRNPSLRPAVVVCPSSVKYAWEREAKRHFGMRAEVLEGTRPPTEGFPRKRHLTILNYEILGRRAGENYGPGWLEYLLDLQPQFIILDEVHNIKNRSAKQTKWVRQLCQGVRHILALSGTPLTNRPAELWTTLNLLQPIRHPAFWSFAHKYCAPKKTYWGWDFSGASNLDQLNKELKGVMIRRRQEDVLADLPARQKVVVPIQIDNRKEYNEALHEFRKWMMKRNPLKLSSSERAKRLTQLGYLRRVVAEGKLPFIKGWIKDFLVESERKLVFFVYHRSMIHELSEAFPESVAVYGGVTGKRRDLAVEKFQHGKKCRLLIGQIKAAGEGLHLTAANSVAFGEYPWTPGALSQACKRIHRIGQTKKCWEYFLVAKATIDEKMLNLLERKQQTVNAVLDGGSGEKFNLIDRLTQHLIEEYETEE